MDVPASVWIVSVVIVIFITWITLWVTKKAYSKKWEDNHNEKDGEFR